MSSLVDLFRSPGITAIARSSCGSVPKSKRSMSKFLRLHRYSEICGDDVVSAQDEFLGTIDELMLDLSTGRVVYAVVSSGGFMGKGERLAPIPWAIVSRDTERHRFLASVEKDVFATSPAFTTQTWPPVFELGLHERIHAHFGMNDPGEQTRSV